MIAGLRRSLNAPVASQRLTPRVPAAPDRWWPALVIVLLLGVAHAAPRLGEGIFWFDEAHSAWYIGFGAPDVISFSDVIGRVYGAQERHPAGYYLAIWAWTAAAGKSEFTVRALSLFFGVLSVAALYTLTRTLTRSGFGALCAALVLGLSPFFLFYWREARMYTLLALCTTLALLAYVRLIERPNAHRGYYALLTLATGGAVFTYYPAAFLFVPLGLYHVAAVRAHRRFWPIMASFALAAVLCAPSFARSLSGTQAGAFVIAAEDGLRGYQIVNGVIEQTSAQQPLLLFGLFAVALVAAPSRQLMLLVPLSAGFFVLNLLAAEVTAFYHIRNLMQFWPLAAVFTAWGFVGLVRMRRWGLLVGAVGLWSTGLFLQHLFEPNPGAPVAASAPAFHALETVRTVCGTPADSTLYYLEFPNGLADLGLAAYTNRHNDVFDGMPDVSSDYESLNAVSPDSDAVWAIIDAEGMFNAEPLPGWVPDTLAQAGYVQCPNTASAEGFSLVLYTRSGAAAQCPPIALTTESSLCTRAFADPVGMRPALDAAARLLQQGAGDGE